MTKIRYTRKTAEDIYSDRLEKVMFNLCIENYKKNRQKYFEYQGGFTDKPVFKMKSIPLIIGRVINENSTAKTR